MAKIRPITSESTKRGMQLFTKYKMRDLPKSAYAYARFLSEQYGGCGEVMLTAFCHYAQAVEKLPCKNDQYEIDKQGIKWFKENFVQEVPNNVLNLNL